MGIFDLLLLSVGLAMDAFAVSVCKGLAMKKKSWKNAAICGIWFGSFQAFMPLMGYVFGVRLTGYLTKITPWIAFILLALIGGKMLREAFGKKEEEQNCSLSVRTMFILAIATSIDALAVGITFACVPPKVFRAVNEFSNVWFGVSVIGIVTFVISGIGVRLGGYFGKKNEKRAEILGGVILLLLGVKILIEGIC